MRLTSLIKVCAADALCNFSVPLKSRKASSIDMGSICGVVSIIRVRTLRPAILYFSMFGGMTTALGQSFRASNIGIAERTPLTRAT